jgi:hypothetical protein
MAITSPADRQGQRFQPAPQASQELPRVEQAEDTAERIVRRNAVRQLQEAAEPLAFRPTKGGDFDPGVAAAQTRAQGDDDDVDQAMQPGSIQAWIGQRRKMAKHGNSGHCRHGHPP